MISFLDVCFANDTTEKPPGFYFCKCFFLLRVLPIQNFSFLCSACCKFNRYIIPNTYKLIICLKGDKELMEVLFFDAKLTHKEFAEEISSNEYVLMIVRAALRPAGYLFNMSCLFF